MVGDSYAPIFEEDNKKVVGDVFTRASQEFETKRKRENMVSNVIVEEENVVNTNKDEANLLLSKRTR